jgi:putative membrane-bound dehydrogenase-like protein
MKYRLIFVFALLALSLPILAEGRRVEILFLGDNDHHVPRERFFQALMGLGPKGINLTYTDRLADLNPATLAKYDGVAIYANWPKIEPAQEKALTEYVQSGHGLIPIHCASFCFQNSAEYIRMVGGQFAKHETGTFTTKIVAAEHPVMKGYAGFETWDETYVHAKLNPDRTVLQVREEEPWTWVRNEGKGRVFYTAYGHDQRTWGNPAFHDLLARGILWAVGEQAAGELAALKLPAFKYDEGFEVPNYERRTPPPKLQEPLSPAESRKHVQWPVDMEFQLVASDPLIVNTIEFQWDERGRLWTIETVDYPNEITPGGPGNDRICVLEDTNGDGAMDKRTVFADGLSCPTSLVFVNGGIIVTQAPHTLFLKDSNGDGKSDIKQTLFSGWGYNDTHAEPSNLKYGFDGWIYGCVGYSGFSGTVGGEQLKFGQGAYRFKADGTKLEFLGRSSNNTWGFAFREDGDVFGSTANNQHSWYLPIAKRFYEMVDGLEQPVTPGIDANKKAPLLMERIRQVDVMGGFTAEAGHNFYTARSFPQEYWNRVALICEPTCHILYKGLLEQKGADFSLENGWNLLASDDEWFAPVFAQTGPDGAIWVSDFYSYLIQHNPTPSVERGGFAARTGKGNAFVSTLRDTQKARIWRLSYKGGKSSQQFALSKDDPKTLLAALRSDNLLWRSHAQRLLVERGQQDVVPELKKLAAEPAMDEIGIAGGAFHALWTLNGLGAADFETLEKALKHPAAGVRRAAMQILPRALQSEQMILDAKLLEDKEPLVRLTALLALADQPASDAVGAELFKLTKDTVVKADNWLPVALTIAASRHANGFLTAALNAAEPLVAAGTRPAAPAPNLIANPGFEKLASAGRGEIRDRNGITLVANRDMAEGWPARTYGGEATHKIVPKGRNGGNCVEIASTAGSDTSVHYDVPMEVDTDYLISGWIKTENLKGATGALLEVHTLNGSQPKSKALLGTNDWQQVSFKISSGKQKDLSLNCLFGGWGRSTGTAWFDDISVVKVGTTTGGAEAPGDIAAVARTFTRYATPTQLTAMNTLLASKPSAVGRTISEGLRNPSKPKVAEDLGALAKTHQMQELKAVEGLKYDVMNFTVKTGKPIAIVFHDADQLQHNLVVAKPGSIEQCCSAADVLATQPDAIAKNYIPTLSDILKATKLLNPGEIEVLKFDALPAGEYPYLCTFPGHCHIMRGVMKVEP